jgi:hypothetical protein
VVVCNLLGCHERACEGRDEDAIESQAHVLHVQRRRLRLRLACVSVGSEASGQQQNTSKQLTKIGTTTLKNIITNDEDKNENSHNQVQNNATLPVSVKGGSQ